MERPLGPGRPRSPEDPRGRHLQTRPAQQTSAPELTSTAEQTTRRPSAPPMLAHLSHGSRRSGGKGEQPITTVGRCLYLGRTFAVGTALVQQRVTMPSSDR
eukprot:7604917-Pyramimonas_sp.AAC.1